jgi:hypothetical protein
MKDVMNHKTGASIMAAITLTTIQVVAAYSNLAFSSSGCLDILSDPQGVDIYLDGRHEGKTPVTCLEVPAGKVTLKVKKKGYATEYRTIMVKPEGITTVRIPMKPHKGTGGKAQVQALGVRDRGSLEVFNLLGPVDVYVDGDRKGKGSVTIRNMVAGTHDLKVGAISRQIQIVKDHRLRVKVTEKGIHILNPRKHEKQVVVERDGRFLRYPNGVVKDTGTGLEWVAGPDKNMGWDDAKDWVNRLNLDGGGWRMPTKKELEGLYQEGKGERNMTPLLKTTGWWVWSEQINGWSRPGYVDFYLGPRIWDLRLSRRPRAFAVRSP